MIFEWLRNWRRGASSDNPRHLIIPIGFDRVGMGISFAEIEGTLYPAVVIFPRPNGIDGVQGTAYPDEIETPPDGSVFLTFASPNAAHLLIKQVLDTIVQIPDVEPEEAAND